jgi:hypothetical protein
VLRLRSNSILLDAVDVADPAAARLAGSIDVHSDWWLDRSLGDTVTTTDEVVVTCHEYPLGAQRTVYLRRMAIVGTDGSSGLRKVSDIEVPCGS